MKNYAGRTAVGEARVNNHKNIVALINQKYISQNAIQKKKLAQGGEAAMKAAIKAQLEEKKRKEREEKMANLPDRDEVAWLKALQQSSKIRRLGMWDEYKDFDVGIPFWFNEISGDCYWEKPGELCQDEWLQFQEEHTGVWFWYHGKSDSKSYGMPPGVVEASGKLQRRIEHQKGKNEMTVVDYKNYWQEEWGEIAQNKAEEAATLLMQKAFRAMRARKRAARIRLENKSTTRINTQARMFLARRALRRKRLENAASIVLERVTRGFLGRQWVRRNRKELEHWQYVIRCTENIRRVWRGHKCRQILRRHRHRKNGPKSFEQWTEFRRNGTLRRVIGVWDEVVETG